MASNQNITFTAREMEVLALAWQCMETQPKINVNKLAALTGYTPGSAGVTFNKIKQKIRTLADSVSDGAPSVPSTPRKANNNKSATPTSTARKRKNAVTAIGGDAMPHTPSKKSKKAVKDEIEEESDGEHDTIAVKTEEEDKHALFGGGNHEFDLCPELRG